MKNCFCFESYVCRNCRVRMKVEGDPMIEVNERLANETARLSRNIEGLTGVAQALLAATTKHVEEKDPESAVESVNFFWVKSPLGCAMQLKANGIYRVNREGIVSEWVGMIGKATDREVGDMLTNAGFAITPDMSERVRKALNQFIAKRGLAD